MKFKVEITETLQRVVEAEAASAEDAEKQVRAAYRAGDIVLDAEDCTGVGITAVRLQTRVSMGIWRKWASRL